MKKKVEKEFLLSVQDVRFLHAVIGQATGKQMDANIKAHNKAFPNNKYCKPGDFYAVNLWMAMDAFLKK